jgi:hypothetical protein
MKFSRPVLSAILLLLGSQLVSAAQAEGPAKQLLDLSSDNRPEFMGDRS